MGTICSSFAEPGIHPCTSYHLLHTLVLLRLLTVTISYRIDPPFQLAVRGILSPCQHSDRSLQATDFILNATASSGPIPLAPAPLLTLSRGADAIFLLPPLNPTLAYSQLEPIFDVQELQSLTAAVLDPGPPVVPPLRGG